MREHIANRRIPDPVQAMANESVTRLLAAEQTGERTGDRLRVEQSLRRRRPVRSRRSSWPPIPTKKRNDLTVAFFGWGALFVTESECCPS